MDQILDILNDTTNNDKLLVKELSVYIKNHRDNKKKFNKKFIMDIIGIIQDNDYDLSLDKIDFYENEFSGSCGERNLTLNINSIFHEAKTNKRTYIRNNGDIRLSIYYVMLKIILHELTHAKQEIELNEHGNTLYASSYEFIKDHYLEYIDNWEITPIERFAEIRSSIIAYQVLSYIYPKNKINDLKVETLTSFGQGYKIYGDTAISPISRFNEFIDEYNLTKITIENEKELSLYEKLYLGLDVPLEELSRFDCLTIDVYNGDKSSVKQLIKKCE